MPGRIQILGAVGLVASGIVVAGFLVFKVATTAPKVAAGYHERVVAAAPIEKRYSALGPHAVATEQHESGEPELGRISIWYPADLRSKPVVFPVVIVSNGFGVAASRYRPVFEHLASWGFIVAGNEARSSGSGLASATTLDLVLKLDADPASPLYRKVDRDHIGAAGHSQGGNGTVRALAQYPTGKLYKAIFTASMMREGRFGVSSRGDLPKVEVPYFMVAGDADGFFAPLSSVRENFKALPNGVPAIMAIRSDANHGDMRTKADGYMTAWFRYHLAGDQEAARAFVGQAPEIARNTRNWRDVDIKNLP